MFIFEIKEWVVPSFLTDGVEEKIYLRLISYFSYKKLKVMNRGYQSPSIMVVWKTARLL